MTSKLNDRRRHPMNEDWRQIKVGDPCRYEDDSGMTTWRRLVLFQMEQGEWRSYATGETEDDIEFVEPGPEVLDQPFYAGFGTSDGPYFTAFSKNFIYFPVVYDGRESVGFVPRHPNGKPTQHWGGD